MNQPQLHIMEEEEKKCQHWTQGKQRCSNRKRERERMGVTERYWTEQVLTGKLCQASAVRCRGGEGSKRGKEDETQVSERNMQRLSVRKETDRRNGLFCMFHDVLNVKKVFHPEKRQFSAGLFGKFTIKISHETPAFCDLSLNNLVLALNIQSLKIWSVFLINSPVQPGWEGGVRGCRGPVRQQMEAAHGSEPHPGRQCEVSWCLTRGWSGESHCSSWSGCRDPSSPPAGLTITYDS